VLADESGQYTPSQWAQVVVDLYHRHRADRICVEKNFGGDMVEATIRTADPSVAIKAVTSSRGKVLRAEPIAAYWEQKRAHIVGSLPALEDQLCNFTHSYDRARDGSPDRLDALVFAATELLSNAAAGRFFSASALLVNGSEPAPMPCFVDQVFALATASDTVDAVAVIYFGSSQRGDDNHPYPLTVLDWSLHEGTQTAEAEWLAAIFARGSELAQECGHHTGCQVPLFVEKSAFGQLLLDQFIAMGWVFLIEPEKLGPPNLIERAAAARAFVATGSVKICRTAYEKTQVFRGVDKNHLTAQILSFDPETKPGEAPLVSAFCVGMLAALRGRETPPSPAPPSKAGESAAPIAPWKGFRVA